MKPEELTFQAFEEHNPLDQAAAEHNLMRAMLRLAMDDVKKGGDFANDARNFFLSGDESYLFSFLSICRELELCAATVLKASGLLNDISKQTSD